jgi:hypothetical protein
MLMKSTCDQRISPWQIKSVRLAVVVQKGRAFMLQLV